MESSKITVIVPTFNEEEGISTLISSLLGQTLRPYEIIISDGESKDSTIEIVEKFITSGEPVRLIKREGKCRGAGRNSGINASSTELICLIDAGINPEKDWIEKLSLTYHDHDSEVVYGMVKPIVNSSITRALGAIIVGKSGNKGYLFPSVASMLIKKSTWIKAGKFKEDKLGRYVVEDLDFINKLEDQSVNSVYSYEAVVNWSIPSSYKTTFNRFSTYSTGTLRASMYKIWHFGLLRNTIIYILLFLFIFKINLLFIIPLLLFHSARAFSYLIRVPWFKKATFKKRLIDLFQTFILIFLIDIASLKGVFDLAKGSIRQIN